MRHLRRSEGTCPLRRGSKIDIEEPTLREVATQGHIWTRWWHPEATTTLVAKWRPSGGRHFG